jgi:Flp pilus assembly protein TadG
MSRVAFPDRSSRGSPHEEVDLHTSSHGQATVEFALILPLVVGVIALIVQIAIIAVNRLEVVDETRHAARIASLAEDPVAAASSSLPVGSTSSVDVVYDEMSVTVTVSRRVDTDVAFIGRLLPSVDVSSRLVMTREPASR